LEVKGKIISNTLFINSTTGSTDKDSGAIIVNGGVGIGENLNVSGNAIINGTLTVLGTTNQIHCENTVLKDNIILLNSAPAGSKDAGIVIERFQKDNDLGEGDIVNDSVYLSFQLESMLQENLKSNEIKLPSEASNIDHYYTGWWIRVASGFSANQIRKIINYNGETKIAQISSPWTVQNPTDIVHLYKRPYVGLYFNEIQDRFDLSSTLKEPESKTDEYTDLIDFKCKSIVTENGYNVISDSKIRQNEKEFEPTISILEQISKLKTIKYKNRNTNKEMLGIIAEEVKDLFPEIVNNDDYTSIDYSQLLVLLLLSIKELKQKLIDEN
jgi:hypothetical protein